MKIELSKEVCEMIARKVVSIMEGEERQKEEKEYVSTREAAHILGVSPDRLRHLKDKFPHIKVGENGQGKLLFLKSGLIGRYVGERKMQQVQIWKDLSERKVLHQIEYLCGIRQTDM